MAKVVKDQTGNFIAIKEDGTRVPVPPSWVGESEVLPKAKSLSRGQQVAQEVGLSPEGGVSPAGENPMIVRNEADTSMFSVGMRNLVKNWSSSTEQAMQTYRDAGMEVKPYGDHPLKMQFAYRPKGTNGVWHPVDPDGFDWQDVTDLLTDVAGGAALSLLPGGGGLVKQAAMLGGASLGLEAGKEAGGAAMGLKENVSPGQIATAGVAGAAIPFIGKAVSPITRLASKPFVYGFEWTGGKLVNAARRIMGARDIEGMAQGEADAILRNAKGRQIVPFAQLARAVQAKVQKLISFETAWPEEAQAYEMLAKAKEVGAKIDFNPIIEGIENAAGAVERRAAGAARVAVTEGEAFAGRAGAPVRTAERRAAGAARPVITEEEAARFREEAAIIRQFSGESDEAFKLARSANKGEAFKTPPTTEELRIARGEQMSPGPKDAGAVKTQPIPVGAGRPAAQLSEQATRAEFRNPGLRQELLAFSDRVQQRIAAKGFRLSDVPPDFAHVIKQDLQRLARKGGAYKDKPIEDAFTRVLTDAAHHTKSALIDAMPGDIQQPFADVMKSYERKTKLAQAVKNLVSDPAAAEAWLREVYGSSNSSALRYVQQLEDEFGVNLLSDVREAQAKEIINKGNIMNFAEKHPFITGAAIFQPSAWPFLGGLAAAPAAGKGLQAVGRGVAKGAELTARAAERAAASPEAKAAAVKLIQAAAAKSGKGITSENQASVQSRSPKRVTRLF